MLPLTSLFCFHRVFSSKFLTISSFTSISVHERFRFGSRAILLDLLPRQCRARTTVQNLFPTPSFALCFRSPFLRCNSFFDNKFSQEFSQKIFKMFSRALRELHREMEHARKATNKKRRYIKYML